MALIPFADGPRWPSYAAMAAALLVAVALVLCCWFAWPDMRTRSANPSHGPVNIGFAQDMSMHHGQALTMARMALLQGSPRVRPLAQSIFERQMREMGYMQGWLMLWAAPSLAASDDMKWARDAYARSPHREAAYDQFIENCSKNKSMPGSATPEELEALEASSSPEAFDRTFLTLMIRHHQGAIVMARFAFDHAESDVVKAFARTIVTEQQLELAWMMTWLRGLNPSPA